MLKPKFDICQGTVAPNCFKSHTNSSRPDFFEKKFSLMSGLKFTLSTVTSFLPDNLSGLKKSYIQACLVIFRSKLELHSVNERFAIEVLFLIYYSRCYILLISQYTFLIRKILSRVTRLNKSH